MGGFVRWSRGSRDDGSDSLASQVVPESHWPEMQVLILVVSHTPPPPHYESSSCSRGCGRVRFQVNSGKKAVSSTAGMQTTVSTSALIAQRADHVVPARMVEMERALEARDFDTFARVTMQDSNQFHGTCLDTYPPIFYMNDSSRAIVQCLTAFNAEKPHLRV